MAESINIRGIIITALITAGITGAVTFFFDWGKSYLVADNQKLEYTISSNSVFRDGDSSYGIYGITIRNSGKTTNKNIVSQIKIQAGDIIKRSVKNPDAIPYSDNIHNGVYNLNIPSLNTHESLNVSLMATGWNMIDATPNVALRADGLSGSRADNNLTETNQSTPEWVFVVAPVIGIVFGYFFGIKSDKKLATITHNNRSRDLHGANTAISKAKNKLMDSDQIFGPNIPFPSNLDQIKVGTPVSLIPSILKSDEGSLSPIAYSVELKHGPFERAVYFHSENGDDPKIICFVFFFRDEKSCESVRSAALHKFGTDGLTTSVMGQVLEWEDLNGFKVRLDDRSYRITPIR